MIKFHIYIGRITKVEVIKETEKFITFKTKKINKRRAAKETSNYSLRFREYNFHDTFEEAKTELIRRKTKVKEHHERMAKLAIDEIESTLQLLTEEDLS